MLISSNSSADPVPANKRIQRHLRLSSGNPSISMKSFALRRFYPHISGLELFFGKKVLEIGGSDRICMEHFFAGTGADYTNVRLEGNKTKNPRVVQGDFMDIEGKFDLVISLGVFELGAIDINFDTSRPLKNSYSMGQRIAKLHTLANEGASVVIGTINAPCLFDDQMLRSAGFSILSRESPFYTFMFPDNPGIYGRDDKSELLILRKR
jgi:hypothetical protein